MIKKLQFIQSFSNLPYGNLALEEFLRRRVDEDTLIFYLWQNRRTVVIGRNQNPWKEVNMALLQKEEGHLARRFSGGGAVFQDLGNLNFSFLARAANYDVGRQLDIVLNALRALGIEAAKSGRNDITVDDRKCSGNAFYRSGDNCCHHGTLMLDVALCDLDKYLTVSRDKLQSKGVASTLSRVVNLRQIQPDLKQADLQQALKAAFAAAFAPLKIEELTKEQLTCPELTELEALFASQSWLWGEKINFTYQIERRFAWGDIDIRLEVAEGRIVRAVCYSDALELKPIADLPAALTGCLFASKAMAEALEGGQPSAVLEDIRNLILEEDI